MTVGPDVNYEELARSTDEFNGAQLKAVCVEAGMIALREGATKLNHEHFLSGIAEGASFLLSPPPLSRSVWLTSFFAFFVRRVQCRARRRTRSITSCRARAVVLLGSRHPAPCTILLYL